MIGHYLGTLTPTQEDRVLTEKLVPGMVEDDLGQRCLYGVAHDIRFLGQFGAQALDAHMGLNYWPPDCHSGGAYRRLGDTFDTLCERFGHARINAAIRNRILSNRAWRTLKPARELVMVA